MSKSRLDKSPGESLRPRVEQTECGLLYASFPHACGRGWPAQVWRPLGPPHLQAWFWLLALSLVTALIASRAAAAPASASGGPGPRFDVQAYIVKCNTAVFTNAPIPMLSKYTGTNVGLDRIVQAASALLYDYQQKGYRKASISIPQDRITNGIVPLYVYQATFPQVLISGRPWFTSSNAAMAAIAQAGVATKTAPTNHFRVRAYAVEGDTLLSTEALTKVLAKYTGTNVTLVDIGSARKDLIMEYRDRGYPTVDVFVPPQTIDSNAIVKVKVVEGRLSEINVVGNRYFSSNNVMRALPSLHTNMILVAPVLESELDRANANVDRQISPEISPGPTEGTTRLDLKVKDRLPLHGKAEFNNQNSPGTPDFRINTSLVYNNLWQLDHSMGVQYSFSPTDFKEPQWDFYDRPQVANYGAFYRLPLGTPMAVADQIEARPGSFGYSEATRKFNLPPPSGQSELNFFASRSTIDTGLMTLLNTRVYDTNLMTLDRTDHQRDLTVNSDIGTRLTIPLQPENTVQASLSAGLDYKSYQLTTAKTNLYYLTTGIINNLNPNAVTTNYQYSTDLSPQKTVVRSLDYLPFTPRYTISQRDKRGVTTFSLGLNQDLWHSGSQTNLENITGSSAATGYWTIFNPTLSRDFFFHTNWTLSLNASGQWSTEPLISNEQFGVGGLGSVRGYHEGESFGDCGWYFTAEQKTPPLVIGQVYGNNLLIVRGSVYMGYGETFTTSSHQDLWGTGFGVAASVGRFWDARFYFSLPLIGTSSTASGQPRFDFSLGAQF